MAATKKALLNKLGEKHTAAELQALLSVDVKVEKPAKAKARKATTTRKPRPKGAAKVSSKVITKGTREAFIKDNPDYVGLPTHVIRDLVASGAPVNNGWHLPSGFVRGLITEG